MNAKTPWLQDKRLFLAVAAVVALLASRLVGVDLDPEVVAGIVATVLGYITNSAFKEASIVRSIASTAPASAPVAPPIAPVTAAEAAKIIEKV